ncbi:VCBS domain-containing protein [Mesorhizobium sp. M1C.F.Ca.ET.193.01.1.1]|uniref:VCBS domain-containing protein n=2 Tax=unclassified Mesorhizobium TaxID=325217 RepID=UPI0016787EE2|nr:VCBS domain-containing protein [Mesorhizobium sp. M1C.F.Ca.ET.193.01.1.1]
MATTTQISGAGGTTTSFSNTPQAQNDVFNYTEDTAVIVSGSQSSILLDVLANDLGGNAKTLYSIDDGTSATTSTKQYAPLDLTTQDYQTSGISSWESIGDGVRIRINNGKVEMDLSQYLQQHYGVASLQALGAGDHINETFTYAIKLANGTLSWASVSVNIQGTNDGATVTAAAGADNSVVEAGGVANGTPGDPNASGQLNISDADAGQNHFQTPASLQGTYGTFTFDTTSGAWTYALNQALADPLTEGQHVTDTLQVTSADGTASYNIVVNITGTNDAAVLSSASVNLTETDDAADISTSGALTISDVDSDPHFVAQAGTAGTYGSFSIDVDGNWSYTASSAHNEFVAGQHYTENFDVVSADGTHTSVHIDILGTNDAAVLSSASVNLTETDDAADISTSGALTISDVDSDPHFVAQAGTAGTYGSFSIDVDGNWSYTASSAHNEFVDGQHYTEDFDVVSADGTHTSVHIDILGTNDAAVLSSASVNLTETDDAADISTSGALTISDVDSDPHFVAQAGTAGTYGSFSIDVDGNWSYTASSAHDEFVAGQHYTENFDVVSADGTHTSVAIDILGTDDGPPRFAPTDIQLTPNTSPTGDVNFNQFSFSGTLSATDPDPGSFVYSITSQSSAGLFSISGDTLSSGNLTTSNTSTVTVQATQVGDPAGPAYQYSETFQFITGSNGNSGETFNSPSNNNGDDILYGNGGADQIFGLAGNDTLFGQSGNDTLNGGDGNDKIVGGAGADSLTGGAGADTFYYGPDVSDSPASAANDIITDFVHGVDKIDLSSIDANTGSGGDQAFLFGGQNPATVANSLTWSEQGGNTIVHVDVNGNTSADFQITLTGVNLGLTASDFVL